MNHIQFSVEETYNKVGFNRKDEFEVNAYYLTKEEAEELRLHILKIISDRGE